MTWSHGTESAIVEPNIKEQWLSSMYVLLLLLLLFIYLLIFFLVKWILYHVTKMCKGHIEGTGPGNLSPLCLSPGVLFM